MNIIVNKGTPDEWRGTLASLLSQDDGLAQDAAMLTRTLERFEVYHGGGGASPEFTIERGCSMSDLGQQRNELLKALKFCVQAIRIAGLNAVPGGLCAQAYREAVDTIERAKSI